MPPSPRRRTPVRRTRVAGRRHADEPQTAPGRPAGGTDVSDADIRDSTDTRDTTDVGDTAAPAEQTPAPVAPGAPGPAAEVGPDDAEQAGEAVEAPVRPRGRRPRDTTSKPSPHPAAAAAPVPAAEPAAERQPGTAPAAAPDRNRRRSGVATLVVLVAVLVIAAGLGAFFLEKSRSITGSGAASNEALVDVGATAQVSGQMRDALETLYTYDHATLDENEAAARKVITDGFVQDFEQQFAEVRELAPPQEAVVTATVPDIAVQYLQDDRAVLLAFIDQRATRKDGEPVVTAGRMSVTAERVEGPDGRSQWKIADVVPR